MFKLSCKKNKLVVSTLFFLLLFLLPVALDSLLTGHPAVQQVNAQQVSCDDPHAVEADDGTCVCASRFVLNPVTGQCEDSLEALGGGIGTNADYATAQADDGLIVRKLKEAALWFGNMVLSLVGVFLTLAGTLLNGAIEITIVKMSTFVDNIPAIEDVWRLIRDLGNIVILFVLLFSAIGTILKISSFNSKTVLTKVIIAAVLINFSLFFTKAIIDISNVATYTIYQEAARFNVPPKTGGSGSNPALLNGISGAFMQGLQLQTFYEKVGEQAADKHFESHVLQQVFFGIIIILIAAFVLFVAAIMLFLRFGILLVLLITSPIGIVGGLIPKLKDHADKWWNTLIGQAVFAPVLMLFILITIVIVRSDSFRAGAGLGDADLNPQTSVAQLFSFFGGTGDISAAFQYFIIIFLLVFSLIVAKQISGGIGKGAIRWAEKTAGKVAYGIPRTVSGTAARAVVGRGAEAIGKRYDNVLAKIPTTTYRNIDRATLGLFGATDRATRQGIKGVEQVKFGTGRTLQDVRTAEKTRQRELGTIDEQKRRQAQIDLGTEHVEELFKNNAPGTFDSETDTTIKNYLEQVKKLSNEQLEDMLQNNLDLLKKQHFAMALSQKQLDFIKESKLIRETDKDEIKKSREEGNTKRVELASDAWLEGARIAAAKPADVANLPKALLKKPEVAAGLNVDALKQILSNATLDTTDRSAIKAEIENRHNALEAKHLAQQAAGAPIDPEEAKQLGRLKKSLGWLNHPDRQLEW